MNPNTLVAVLMAMLNSNGETLPDGRWRIRAEALDGFSHDLRHVVMVQPVEEEGVRYVEVSIADRPGFELGVAGRQ